MTPKREQRLKALLSTDKAYSDQGLVIAGMDEAGRGPLVGCVVAACVIMPESPVIEWVDDSKKLSEKRREEVFEQIRSTALYIGTGEASAEEIDRINILNATKEAMRRAAQNARADLFLIDALSGLGLNGKELGIVHGDALSYSIAAASIIAKVTRDRKLIELDRLYPEYGFARNKGYGTKEHIEALKRYGPCPFHRRSFITHFV